MDYSIHSQVVPEALEEGILRLLDGMNEKEEIFKLLNLESGVYTRESEWVHTGKNIDGVKNIWMGKEQLESNYDFPLKKKKLASFIKYLDGDLEQLISKYPRTADSLVEDYCKKKYIAKKKRSNKSEYKDILRRHFQRDVESLIITELTKEAEEAKCEAIDAHYRKRINESYININQAPWREEYITKDEEMQLQKITSRLAFMWSFRAKGILGKKRFNYKMKKSLAKMNLSIEKKTNTDGYPVYDYDSIEPKIDYNGLVANDIKYNRSIDLREVDGSTLDPSDAKMWFSDENVKLYMKECHAKIYFKSEHNRVFGKD